MEVDNSILKIYEVFFETVGGYVKAVIDNAFNSEQIKQVICNAIKTIESIYPTDEERKGIISNLQKWGDYGWGMIRWAPIKLYSSTPTNTYEADNMVMQYCTDEKIDELLISILKKTDRISEFQEADWCYKNEKYTASALILFSIIDSMMIRLQQKGSNTKRKLAKQYANELLTNQVNCNNFLAVASFLALMNAIKNIFENANDFSSEDSELINRNFVSHGMNARKVNKTDCIKLFVIIEDLFQIMEEFNLNFESDIETLEVQA